MSAQYKVLVTAPPILPHVHEYESIFKNANATIVTPDFIVEESLRERELNRLLVDIDGILCGDDFLTESVLKQANKLKVISKWGTGVDSIDLTAAQKLGIKVCRVTDVFAAPVADTVLAYILLFARQIPQKNKVIQQCDWHKVKSFALNELSLGVVGVGHIGQAVLERAAAFGMKLYGCDVNPVDHHFLEKYNIELLSLEDLLKCSDFVSLNCSLNQSTYKLMSKETLGYMKKTAYLINTARGRLVDEQALIQALHNQEIAGAALDVFEVEPLPHDSCLRNLDNVWLSPHNSNGSPAVFRKVDEVSIYNVLEALESEKRISEIVR